MVHSIFQEDDIIGSANQKLSALIALGVLVCLVAAGYANFYQHHFADSSGLNATIFFFIAFLLSFILRKNFCIGFFAVSASLSDCLAYCSHEWCSACREPFRSGHAHLCHHFFPLYRARLSRAW